MEFSELAGKTLTSVSGVEKGSAEVVFAVADGDTYRLYDSDADNDNAFEIWLEDVEGDISDLIDSPITIAEVSSGSSPSGDDEFAIWAFYRISSAKGMVTFRWCGHSNGHYGELAGFEVVAVPVKR